MLAQIRQVVVHHKIHQGRQSGHKAGVFVVGQVLEVAKADEARGQAGDHGRGLGRLAHDRLGRGAQAQRPAGGNAQPVHGLAAQELAD